MKAHTLALALALLPGKASFGLAELGAETRV